MLLNRPAGGIILLKRPIGGNYLIRSPAEQQIKRLRHLLAHCYIISSSHLFIDQPPHLKSFTRCSSGLPGDEQAVFRLAGLKTAGHY